VAKDKEKKTKDAGAKAAREANALQRRKLRGLTKQTQHTRKLQKAREKVTKCSSVAEYKKLANVFPRLLKEEHTAARHRLHITSRQLHE